MSEFIVSARKYRPTTFDSVVGQQSITGTLKNAISSDKIAQAFLFCGPRGVGKTTCARILAKTINCFEVTDGTEACDKCESCVSFNEGKSLNILELDAASNNSVDDIRNLIDQVRFAPQIGDYKVYIIDEVHMLSQQAFNAFLKTLEEPPAHAIFILATTEKHKIIPTILSRCQIFDFKRIQVGDIASHLSHIAEKEEVSFEGDALHLIGQKADGALRDALSMFDQLVSFTEGNLTQERVIDNLNILDYDYYFKIADAVLKEDVSGALIVLDEILNKGFNGHSFIVGLAEHFRNLLVGKNPDTVRLMEVSDGVKKRYLEQSQAMQESTIFAAIRLCNECDVQYKASKNPRLLVEFTLMQLCSILDAEKKNFNPFVDRIPILLKAIATIAKQEKSAVPTQETRPAAPPRAPISAQTPPPEKNVVSLKRKLFKTKTLSISGNSSEAKEKEEEEEIDYSSMPHESFDISDLKKVWAEYASNVKADGRLALHSTLTKFDVELEQNTRVIIRLENAVQEGRLGLEKPNLLAYIRDRLNNYSISLESKLEKIESEKVYTSRDRFAMMIEKNPNLMKLKNLMDLEIEY